MAVGDGLRAVMDSERGDEIAMEERKEQERGRREDGCREERESRKRTGRLR